MADSLTSFEGIEVTQAKIEIRNVGGGLQEAMKFDPVEIHKGQRRWVAVEVECDSVRFDPIKDSDCLARVHIMKPVDDKIGLLNDDPKLVERVKKHVESAVERTRLRKERAAGVMRLGAEEGDSEGQEGEPFGHAPEPIEGEGPAEKEGPAEGEEGWAEGYPQGLRAVKDEPEEA